MQQTRAQNHWRFLQYFPSDARESMRDRTNQPPEMDFICESHSFSMEGTIQAQIQVDQNIDLWKNPAYDEWIQEN